mgnify:FL=1|tara:strand:+ start:4567 stop:4866 length:300 start_codon:yes stop_codon:yes gene_type:complete
MIKDRTLYWSDRFDRLEHRYEQLQELEAYNEPDAELGDFRNELDDDYEKARKEFMAEKCSEAIEEDSWFELGATEHIKRILEERAPLKSDSHSPKVGQG